MKKLYKANHKEWVISFTLADYKLCYIYNKYY